MSTWPDESSFITDLSDLSDFNQNGESLEKSLKTQSILHPIWYDLHSDIEPQEIYAPVQAENHHNILKDVQKQVRSTVGSCYNNEAIELYYKTLQYEDELREHEKSIASTVPRIETRGTKNVPKKSPVKTKSSRKGKSVAEMIEESLKNLETSETFENSDLQSSPSTSSMSGASSSSVSPSERPQNQNRSRKQDKKYTGVYRPLQQSLNVHSRLQFPSL